jgi:hypothetical protein
LKSLFNATIILFNVNLFLYHSSKNSLTID